MRRLPIESLKSTTHSPSAFLKVQRWFCSDESHERFPGSNLLERFSERIVGRYEQRSYFGSSERKICLTE